MPETKRPLKVFLCHASTDKPKVRELYRYLKRRGINPWFDEEHLVGGQDWQVEIPKALATSDAIIICLTKNSVDKEGYIQREIKFALDKALEMPEGRIFLIPVKFEDCEVPFTLSRYQWVDLTIETGYSKMMKALKFRASQLERSTVELSKKTVEEEKLALEKAAKEKAEREAAELAARKITENEAVEKALLKAEEKEKQKAARIKAEREAAKKAAREEENRDSTKREFVAPKPEIQRPRDNTNTILGVIVFIAVALVIGLSSLNGTPSTPVPTSTRTLSLQISPSNTTIKTSMPSSVPTKLISTPTQLPTGTALPLQAEITDSKGVQMALVPAGEFTMGASADFAYELCKKNSNDCDWSLNFNSGEIFQSVSPSHKVYLDSYYIDKYEVTNTLYRACVDSGICTSPTDHNSELRFQNPNYNVYPVLVDWNAAERYCEWRGGGLPTEAQWEKAARGTDGRTFPWGEEITCGKANYRATTGKSCFSGIDPNIDINFTDVSGIAAIGKYEKGKSPYGLYDMAGNVSEWVADWYSATYYQNSPLSNPLGPESGDDHLTRGGSWITTGEVASTFWRGGGYPVGFRCFAPP